MFTPIPKHFYLIKKQANLDSFLFPLLSTFNYFLESINEFFKTINVIFFWLLLILIYLFLANTGKCISSISTDNKLLSKKTSNGMIQKISG